MTSSDNGQFEAAHLVKGAVTEVRDVAIRSKCIPVDCIILIDHSIALPHSVMLTIMLQCPGATSNMILQCYRTIVLWVYWAVGL